MDTPVVAADKRRSSDQQDEIENLRGEIATLTERIEALRLSAAAEKAERQSLQNQITYLQSSLGTANERITALYESRIWRTLTLGGRLVYDVLSTWHSFCRILRTTANTARSLGIRFFSPGVDQFRLHSDFPSVDATATLCGEVEIRGWACAKSGVASFEVYLDGRRLESVEYGVPRPDVGAHLPDFLGSSRSGFKAIIKTRMFREGLRELRYVTKAKSGRVQEVIITVQVDPRTTYEIWLERNAVDDAALRRMAEQLQSFPYQPKISIVTPVYRTPKEFLTRCVESVQAQAYPNWELILVDDDSRDSLLRENLKSFAQKDGRIRVYFQSRNSGIAVTTNAALEHSTGEYVGFLDHDDELAPDALFEVVKALNQDRSWDIFYSDEDKITADGSHKEPFFKPDWSPDLLLSENYVCHFLVCRRLLLEGVGGLRTGFDGSQDYDLVLRLTEKTDKVHRIPRVLYHWRISETSTAGTIDQKPAASQAGLRALQDRLARTAPGATVSQILPCRYRVRYPLRETPEVDIIIPTGGSPMLERALDTVLRESTYPNYRLTVVDNSRGDSVRHMVRRFDNAAHPIRMIDMRGVPFNFSLLCNRPARSSQSPYLLFLNDDTSIITPDWIETMMEHGQRKEVGAVGSLLLFPDGKIQHAGVILGVYGLAGHSFRFLDSTQHHYFCLPSLTRNCSAVTGACLLVGRDTFWEVGGFEETQLPLAFQDVDLCLKLHEKGYRIIYTPHARLYHYESATKTKIAHQSEQEYMRNRWRAYIQDDPYYNPNLTLNGEDYSVRL